MLVFRTLYAIAGMTRFLAGNAKHSTSTLFCIVLFGDVVRRATSGADRAIGALGS